MKERLLDVLKSAVEVNLRYSSIALNLSKEYIKEFDRAVRDGAAAKPGSKPEPASSNGPTPPNGPATSAPTRRQPILLVGQLSEEASGAFVLNNTSASDLNVGLVVQGELDPDQVQLVPESFVLAAGASTVVRLKVALTGALEENRDYSAAVFAPGLSAQAIEFVIRRLPGETAVKPAKKRKASANRKAG